VAARFAEAGLHAVVSSRDEARCGAVADAVRRSGGESTAVPCDAADPAAVESLFQRVERDLGIPEAVVYNAGTFQPGRVTDIEPEAFERCWRVGCFGGYLVGRRAAQGMLGTGHGTIIFTGATASLRGGAGFANLAVGKFGLRALAQSMARELGPQNIHVAHSIIDGQILSERHADLASERPEDALLVPEAIADQYLALHRQHRSAWTHELDFRPWVERW